MVTYDDKLNEALVQKSPGISAHRVTLMDGIIDFLWDYVEVTYPNTTTETYTFKTGGASGTTTGVLNVVYTDSSKANLSTVTRV